MYRTFLRRHRKNPNPTLMAKRFLLFLMLALVATAGYAQDKKQQKETKVKVSGRVLDVDTGEALVHATVQIMRSDTTGLVAGGVTSTTGAYSIQVPKGQWVMRISYIGYHNFTRALTIDGTKKEVQGGTVMMTPSSAMLQTATVTATMRQMEVKEDTLIFNADAFKTPEGSVLEELLKKMPGIEVEDNGTVKFNGKTVSKILVGGKEFFGNDRNMALKNLPTEIVDKVKAYDKQSDMARMTGIDDGEEETVLDLTIKKGMQQGWFGNADLAVGTEELYAERVMLNRFQDRTQYSLVGQNNNTGGNGTTTTHMGGFNMALERGKWEIGGNVRYNGSKRDSWSKSSSQNFVTTNSSFSNNFNDNLNKNRNVNGDFRIEWKPDSMTTLNFRPNFSFGNSNSKSQGLSATFNADPYDTENLAEGLTDVEITNPLEQMELISHDIKVNQNENSSRSKGNNVNFGGNLILNRRLNNVGRNFSIRLNGNYSDNESKNYSLSDVTYFQRNDSIDLTYRYRTTPNSSRNITAGFNYSEPLIAKTLFLQTNYSFNYQKRHSDGKTYDMGDIEYLVDSIRAVGAGFLPYDYNRFLDEDLSRYTDNENKINTLDVQLRWVNSLVNLNVGVRTEHQHQRVDYQYQGLDTIASRSFMRVSPTLNLRLRFSRQHTLRVTYRGNTQQPNITDMFSMTDNSNPLNIREGNPNLKPSFTNSLNIDWNNYLTTTLQNFNARLQFQNTLNNIENRTAYNEETGGRITRPENINGDWNMNGNFGFTTPIYWDNLTLSTTTSGRYQNNVSYIYQNQQTLKNKVRSTTLGENLRVNYREDLWDVSLTGRLSYNHTRSVLVPTNNRDTYDFSYGFQGNYTFENGLAFSTNISMSSRRGYSSAAMNTNELIWNAQASYRFLKRRQATISLQAYDILNKRSNISRSISAMSRTDSESNAVYSYFMVHFIYRFNLWGTREGRQQLRRERQERERMNF